MQKKLWKMSSLITTGIRDTARRSIATTNPLLNGVRENRIEYVRVTKVILHESDVDANLWTALDGSQALYGVFYEDLYDSSDERSRVYTPDNFAYCGNANFRHIPIPGELVRIISQIRIQPSQEDHILQEASYWTDVITAWNLPGTNYFIPSGKEVPDKDIECKNNPLQLNTGDITLEGRYGQSIRLGGVNNQGINDNLEQDNPYIIIRNGQGVNTDLGEKPVYEDINRDDSSIYLTSKQTVNLQEANTKRTSWKEDTPKQVSEYIGPQIVLNSDRIVANAKKADLMLMANAGIAVAGQNVCIDGNESISVDADKVYLGSGSHSEKEPILKGKQLTDWLGRLCELLKTFLSSFSNTDREELATIAGIASALMPSLQQLCTTGELSNLCSKKVFTE